MGDNAAHSSVPLLGAAAELDWLTPLPGVWGTRQLLHQNQAMWWLKLSLKLLMGCLTQSYHLTTVFYEALSEELRQQDNRLLSAIAGLQVCPWWGLSTFCASQIFPFLAYVQQYFSGLETAMEA